MARVVVAGFATIDYVVLVEGDFTGRGTRLMREAAWPRAGGAALYASAALTKAGVAAAPLTWVGDDADGAAYRATCVSTEGVAVIPGAPSTRCLLIYNADGTYGCLLRPGPAALTDAQPRLVVEAEWLVIAAGPPEIAARLLDLEGPRLAWIAKDDSACFPSELVARLTARAAVIFCNAGERAWLEAGRTGPAPIGQLMFETRGGDGVHVEAGDGVFDMPVIPLAVGDATGAGDTFAGAALAALIGGAPPRGAAEAGIAAAGMLLAARRTSSGT